MQNGIKMFVYPNSQSKIHYRAKGSDIFIVIPSGPEERHLDLRHVIRETWKLDLTDNMNLTFFVGMAKVPVKMKQKLRVESAKYKDMVFLENYEESYTGLTAKMVEIHKHVVRHYYGIKWLFKTDTDSWVNVKLLVKNLDIPNVKTMYGRASGLSTPVVGNELKEYNNINYPRFSIGAGYAVSYDVVEWIVEQFISGWFKIFTNEDAALGIWVSATGTNIIHTDKVNNGNNKLWKENENLKDCEIDHYVIHYLTPAALVRRAHSNFKSCGNPCGCIPVVDIPVI